ncbi:H-NS histone family protein [Chitiniphilus purpureus]|uniref:H-NS histone family protein n=1 Tax=Chitiniphilus purpureus TaxID=2981137 RepID=A0ABY6DM15_9NEIS|nr:H-NS histone family protein [Chitiniphilus sp. CD1]UXY15415.1 H-NS histone family protein [Chitiniphilus sp. CD1]
MDLSQYSLPQLYQLQKDVEKTIAERQVSDKKRLLDELQQLAASKGFSLNDVLGVNVSKKAGKAAGTKTGDAKYANPADRSQTWTGRGRKPAWVVTHLDQGGSLDDLAL